MKYSDTKSNLRRPAPTPSKKPYMLIGVIVAAVLVLGGGVTTYIVVFSGDPDENEIKRLIKNAAKAAEKQDIQPVVAMLDESYTDNLDNDYAKIVEETKKEIKGVSNIRIKLRNFEITVDKTNGRAASRFEMLFRANVENMGRKLPVCGLVSDMNPLKENWEMLNLRWTRKNNQWLVERLEIKPAS